MEDPVEVKRIGVSEVYASEATPEVDIVFVHGLGGHPYDTWVGKKKKVFWPVQLLSKDLAKRKENVRILVYGYNADVYAYGGGKTSSDRIHNHAQTLVQTLYANRSLEDAIERPIVFVCHSLGGIVVKRALQYSRSITDKKIQHLRSIYVSTSGILFLGTPHNGTDAAKLGSTLRNLANVVLSAVVRTEPQLINALQTSSETIQNINVEFTNFQRRFNLFFFHETLRTSFGVKEDYIVDEPSAAPNVEGAEYAGIEANHSEMSKFDSKNSPGYDLVAEAIQRYANKEALAVIKTRWQEDRKRLQEDRLAEVSEIFGTYPKEDKAPSPSIGAQPHQPKASESHNQPGTLKALPAKSSGVEWQFEGVEEKDIEMAEATFRFVLMESQLNAGYCLSQSLLTILLPVVDPPHDPEHPSVPDPNPDEPLFIVPPDFSHNTLFVGMEMEMNELNKLLFDAEKRAEGTACVLLWCLPGGGKTHLARQYVYTEKNRFPGGVFWVTAKSLEELVDGFWHIAQKAALKGLRDPRGFTSQQEIDVFIEPVKDWFESREEWLLVFDGISIGYDGELSDLRRFIPNRQNSSIIYTSIDRTLARKHLLLSPVPLKVEQLKVHEAQELLIQELTPKRRDKIDKSNAAELVEKMQCLPLMIHAAAHYMNTTGLPLRSYLKSYSKGQMEMLEQYQRIFESLTNSSAEATNLINILCFFGQHIPVEMLQLGIWVMDQMGYPVKVREKGHEDLNKTIRVLIRYSLVDRNDPDDLNDSECSSPTHQEHQHDTLKLHSVVQDFACEFLQDDKYKWLGLAVKVFCHSYGEADSRIRGKKGVGKVSDYHQYKIHGIALWKHIHRYEKEHRDLNSARFELEKTIESIKLEIRKRTPSSSQGVADVEPPPISIFDRSSSSTSSMGPDTPPRTISTVSTSIWGLEPGKPHMESPIGIIPEGPHGVLPGSSPHLSQYEPDDKGYMSDRDEPGPSSHSTPTVRQLTPRPNTAVGQDDGWQLVRAAKTKANKSNDGRPPTHRTIYAMNRRRYRDQLGAWRNTAPTSVVDPRVNRVTAEGSVSMRPVTAKVGSETGNTAAQIALSMAFQKASPPGSLQGGGAVGRKQSSDHSIASPPLPHPRPTSYAAAVAGPPPSDILHRPSSTGSAGVGATSVAMSRDHSGASMGSHHPSHPPSVKYSSPNLPVTQPTPPQSAALSLPPNSPSSRPPLVSSPPLRYVNAAHRSDPTLQSLPGLENYGNGNENYYPDPLGQVQPYGRHHPLPFPYDQIAIPSKRPVPQDFRGHGRFDAQYPPNNGPQPLSPLPHGHPYPPIIFGSDPYVAYMNESAHPTGYTSQPMSRNVSQQSADTTQSVADTEPARFPPTLSPPTYSTRFMSPRERERHVDGAPVRKSPKYAPAEPNSGNISPISSFTDRPFTADHALQQVGMWAESPPSPPSLLGEHGRHSSERSSGDGLGINTGGQTVQFGDAAAINIGEKSAQLRRLREQQRLANDYHRRTMPSTYLHTAPYPFYNLMPRTTSDLADTFETRPRGASLPGQPPRIPSFLTEFPDEGIEMRPSRSKRMPR
ncbi:hypothetical protein GP486_001837 [Trichoglossum hirsutum]|uniref:AB hydrolase-1 domain-containing protein n=1 Tax=Trichoglossum hirsutum TaxID=265104 RepID=A0A9P8RSN6_9PEZI|nr:hypothetical protein GP486_001837 [Trichoglossum hirsutum]